EPQVLAAVLAPSAPSAHELAEQVVEHVGEGRGEVERMTAAAACSAHALLERGMTEAVIGGALVAVLEDVVGLVQFLEAVLGGVVAVIAVRMMILRELAEGALDLLDRRGLLDTQDFVITALRHAHSLIKKRPSPLRREMTGSSSHH